MTLISMGFFAREDQPVVWRGPMLHKALEQFLTDVHWGEPDFLVVDMPPGTGDIALSMAQFLPRAEVVVVTTPQPAAQKVAQRAAYMARKVNLGVVGVIENMSWFDVRPRRRATRCSARAAVRSSPTISRCRCSARCRSCPSCAPAATPGGRSWSRTPTTRRRSRSATIADAARRGARAQAHLPHRAQDHVNRIRDPSSQGSVRATWKSASESSTPLASSSSRSTTRPSRSPRPSRRRSAGPRACCGSPTRRASGRRPHRQDRIRRGRERCRRSPGRLRRR